jgi:heme/copper-type cytochrome/quinol oxidase subunit 4
MSDAAVHPAAGEHHEVNYMAKFYWLVALTTAEVIAAFTLKEQRMLLLPILTVLSIWKALIVLNYFMHLKTESLGLKLCMTFPLVLICVLVLLFLADGYWGNYSAMQG